MRSDAPGSTSLSRRAFLSSGLAAVGGLVAVSGAAGAASASDLQPLVLSSDLYASSDPQRVVFALARGGRAGLRGASTAPAQVRFRSSNGAWTPFERATLDRAGLPRGRGVYTVSPVLDLADTWRVEARSQGERIPFLVAVEQSPIVAVPGDPASRAASPTVVDTLGVDPICTRDPECSLHAVSLASVIGAGKPVAALFATPARCASQYCGPVLDELLRVKGDYEDRVTFVHVEIYESSRSAEVAPTVAAWGLPSEPWLFGIDGAGTIVSRIDGAFGGKEMRKLLDQLV